MNSLICKYRSEWVSDQNHEMIPWSSWAFCLTGSGWNPMSKFSLLRNSFPGNTDPKRRNTVESIDNKSSRCLPNHPPSEFQHSFEYRTDLHSLFHRDPLKQERHVGVAYELCGSCCQLAIATCCVHSKSTVMDRTMRGNILYYVILHTAVGGKTCGKPKVNMPIS